MDAGIEQAFFSQRNRQMLVNMIERDMQAIRKKPLSESQKNRIGSITDHYMNEVYKVQGNKPLAFLNKETIAISEKQFQRSKHFPAVGGGSQVAAAVAAVAPAIPAPTRTFASVVAGSDDDNQLSTAELFKKEKTKRNGSAGVVGDEGAAGTSLTDLEGASGEGFDLVNSLGLGAGGQAAIATTAAIFSKPAIQIPAPTLQQHVIIKEEDVQNYREIESNLILYSVDRDWTGDYGQNRYNFSVIFDPAVTKQGEGRSLQAMRRFNNIVRIELVKAILPLESIDTLVYKEQGTAGTISGLEANVFTLPQVVVHIDEFGGNNYGTDSVVDNAFGVIQYDGTWKADANGQAKGYVAMVPKFMKCQRIFYPTPLATLQKLSIRLERPDGTLIDTHADVFTLNAILHSSSLGGSIYYSADNEYIGIRTTSFFSHFRMQRGDKLILKNLNVVLNAVGTPEQITELQKAADEFRRYLTQSEGHLVCDVMYDGGESMVDGWNGAGYANVIVIRNRFVNPETGMVARNYFGGSSIAEAMMMSSSTFSGPLINSTRQTQLVFRIITREVDSTTQIRPDNIRP